jgi:hypothetical protein
MTALLIGSGGYLFNISIRTLRTGQFPPAGMRVLKDAPVIRGKQAKGKAMLRAFLAILIVGVGVIVAIFIWWALSILFPAATSDPVTKILHCTG